MSNSHLTNPRCARDGCGDRKYVHIDGVGECMAPGCDCPSYVPPRDVFAEDDPDQ